MTFTAPTHGLPGRFLLRLAHRLASPAAYERVFVPLLADFQFEYRRATSPGARLRVRLKWILAFGQTLGLEVGHRLRRPPALERLGHVGSRSARSRGVSSRASPWPRPCAASPSRWTCSGIPSAGSSSTEWAISPSCCRERSAWRYPPACCSASYCQGVSSLGRAALAASPRRGEPGRPRHVRPRGLDHPERESRLPVAGDHAPARDLGAPRCRSVARGDREMTFGELSARAAELRGAGMRAAADRLDLEWHKKPALGASCLALALAGAAIARRLRGRAWRWPASLLVLLGFFWLLRLGEQAADAVRSRRPSPCGARASPWPRWGSAPSADRPSLRDRFDPRAEVAGLVGDRLLRVEPSTQVARQPLLAGRAQVLKRPAITMWVRGRGGWR